MKTSVLQLKNLAINSYRGTSFTPEERGEALLQSINADLTEFLNQLPEEIRDDYETRYIEKCKTWLNAKSRTFSYMITGGANFNNRRHDKMNRYEESAYEKFTTWKQKVLNRNKERNHRLTGWAEVERLQNKLEKLTELQELMKTVNKIIRSTKMDETQQREELEALGLSSENIEEIIHPKISYYNKGYQRFELSLNLAKIKATEDAIKRHTTMATKEDIEKRYDNVTVQWCYSEERIRLIFDNIPDLEMRTKLKKSAFKWSPKNNAWQRQLTPNAVYAAKKILNIQ